MKVDERETAVVIDLKSIKLPGWVWIFAAAAIMYVARTYISDSGLVELIGLGVYAIIKYVEVQVNSGQLEQVESWIKRAHAEINRLRTKSTPEAGMRSAPTLAPEKPVEIKQPSTLASWAFD